MKDGERLATLEANQLQNMADHKEIKDTLAKTNEKLDQLLDRLEKKFAAKRVEIAMKGFMGTVFAYVIYYILEQVIAK